MVAAVGDRLRRVLARRRCLCVIVYSICLYLLCICCVIVYSICWWSLVFVFVSNYALTHVDAGSFASSGGARRDVRPEARSAKASGLFAAPSRLAFCALPLQHVAVRGMSPELKGN